MVVLISFTMNRGSIFAKQQKLVTIIKENAPVIPITGAKKLRGTTQIYSFICSLNAAIRQPYTANRLAFRQDTPKRTSASFRVRSLQPPTSLSKTLPHAYLLVHRASRGRFNLMLIIARFPHKWK